MEHKGMNLRNILSCGTFLLIAFFSCGGSDGGETKAPVLTDKEIDAERAKVLAYISDLSGGGVEGVLSGQNCGHGNEIAEWNYDRFIEALHTQTGQYVSIIGVDYEYMREYTVDELKAANTVFKKHWLNGGLVAINMSPVNPWGNKHNWEDIKFSWPGTKYNGTDLMKLITPGSEVYDAWMAKLDRIAEGLKDLRDAGVIVMWRPMQEMNGWWFWWGKTDKDHLSDSHDAYVAVWRHMHDYFTKEKKLNNLLWVFSPTQNQKFSSFPYPGDAYVDIVAGTEYLDDLSITGYEDFLAYGKPIGIAEYGPSEFGLKVDGSFDNRQYLTRLKNDYPKVAYWMTWESWTNADGT
ncbi:MAG TPA: glycosyl hydrolase, partial [Spirochaetota bacterium]